MSKTKEEKTCPISNLWKPTKKQLYFTINDNGMTKNVVVNCKDIIPIEHSQFFEYQICMRHYVDRLDDITQHINYFINKYDDDRAYLIGMLSVKYLIDINPNLSNEAFYDLVMQRIVTDEFVNKVKRMVDDLYQLDIDRDTGGNYKSTPKITNANARVILGVSFAIRLILLPSLHYFNMSPTKTAFKDYIPLFGKLFMKVIKKFEANFGENVYLPISKFVRYRVERRFNTDRLMWEKKKQAHGTTLAEYLYEIIMEVIIIKSIYKISFDQSIVSYFDGIIRHHYKQFTSENYRCKPIEISSEDFNNDSDDYLSHGEAIEMSLYHIDESNTMINNVNVDYVYNNLIHHVFALVKISQDEVEYYKKRVRINKVIHTLLHTFYSKYFGDSSAVQQLSLDQTIHLLLILKHFLQMKGMVYLPQICTANLEGKFRESNIKNSKFIEKFQTSNSYPDVREKYKYVMEAYPKDDPVTKLISTIINSSFVWVDPSIDPNDAYDRTDNIPMDDIIEEYLQFLLIS